MTTEGLMILVSSRSDAFKIGTGTVHTHATFLTSIFTTLDLFSST